MIAILCALALADPGEPALDPILQRIYDEGRDLEERNQLSAAAIRYRLVMSQVENWRQPALDLARLFEAQGRYDDARRLYAQYPDDADAIEAHGRLELKLGATSEAAALFRRLRNLRPEWPGARLLEAAARALTEPDLAAGLVEEYLEFGVVDPEVDDLSPVAGRVAQGLRGAGEHEAALELIQDVVQRFPELSALLALVAEIEVDRDASALAAAADQPLPAEAVARLREAREAFAGGEIARSRDLLEALIAEHPLSAVTWGTLADVREASLDIAGAEQAVQAAERLDPVSATYPAKLGELLMRWHGGRYDAEAAAAFDRAVSRRPDDATFWYRKAQAERRSGRWSQSVASFERLLALDPEGPYAQEARIAVEGAKRSRAELPIFPAAERPADVSLESWWAFHRAWAWTMRSEEDAPDRALRELATARAMSAGFVRALDLEATIRSDRGETDAAIALLEESLAREPDRGAVVGRLAALYARAGRVEEAAALRDRAAALGDPDALWRKARSEASRWRWLAARQTLAEFFAHTSGGSAYDDALLLDADLVYRIRAARTTAIALTLAAIAAPIALWRASRGGLTVDQWLQQAPASWREVARIVAAIQHEVLKHHTTVLPTVADAIDRGDTEQARWLCERLFGPEGAIERFDAYLAELSQLARASGARLSLRHRDPVFAPLLAAVDALRLLRRPLLRGGDPKTASRLRAIGEALNQTSYRALGALAARLCVTQIDEASLRDIHRAVQAEPEFRSSPVPLEIEIGEPATSLFVPLFPADLSDLIGNLLRNAMQATLLDAPSAASSVGIALQIEVDDITALETVAIRVRDRAPSRLTTEALRGRLITRGLGLAVDLASRASGSIRVEPEDGWEKAVVVRLPRAERA